MIKGKSVWVTTEDLCV